MTERAQRLRARLSERDYSARAADLAEGYDWSLYRDNPVVRQGHLMKYYLERLATPVYPEELIVGGIPYTEVDSNRQIMPDFLFPRERAEREALAAARFQEETGKSKAPDYDEWRELFYGSVNHGHIIIGYERALKKGLGQMAEELRLRQKDFALTSGQKDFLTSALYCLEGAQSYIRRYGEEAERQAKDAPDARRRELKEISRTCRHIAFLAPVSFRQALQMVWFLQILVELESGLSAFSYGRLDQYLYPYLKADLESGLLTREEAQELVDCFWIKNGEYPERISDPARSITIGGMTGEGKDGVNPLSFMLLRSLESCRLLQPKLNARIFPGTDPEFFLECCRVNRQNLGPMLYNDTAVLEALEKYGYAKEDAVDYGLIGCYEYGLAGMERPSPMGAILNVGKCLELALNNGVSLTTGKVLGPALGDLTRYHTCEEVEEALTGQVKAAAALLTKKIWLEEYRTALLRPQPMLSLFVEDCVEKAADLSLYGARYSSVGVRMPGLAAVSDSLTALRTLCFEEMDCPGDSGKRGSGEQKGEIFGKFSKERILQGLRTNFEKDAVLRAALINRAPKYGNDDDRADRTMVWLCRRMCEIISDCPHPSGSRLRPGIFSFLNFLDCGQACGALPDGRRAGEPFVNGISPSHGMDKNGPTAFLRSAGKLDYSLSNNASTLDFKVPPQVFQGEEGDRLLKGLISDYFKEGGMQIQLYFLSKDDLLRARSHPEEYAGLTVRVTGYSAYFVRLTPELQEEIIQRTAAF